jgi:2-keto-4-pentenoate hydratase
MRDRAQRASALLAAAEAAGKAMPDLPAELRPETIAEALAIQDAALASRPSWGWKVGPGEAAGILRAAPLCGIGPMISPARVSPVHGTMIEVEVALRLHRDLSGGEQCPADAVGSVHLAFEVFRSRFCDRTVLAYPSILADHLNNAGMVLGGGQPFEADFDYGALSIRLLADDVEVALVANGASGAVMLGYLGWLADHAASRGHPLRKGSVILTGARIGPVPIAQVNEAHSPIGSVRLTVA